jgi:hypothetical protein
VLLIGGEIVFGQNDGLAGQAVAEGVERDAALAFGGDGPSGTGGVFAVDRGPGFSRGQGKCGWMWIHDNTSISFPGWERAKRLAWIGKFLKQWKLGE